MSDELINRIDKLRTLIAGKPELRWGVVASISPLTIRLDGDTEPLAGTPASNVTGLALGDRVSVLIQNRRATIMGRAQGADVSDTGWHNLALSNGWSAYSGHTPRARLKSGFLCIEGAVLRGSGGSAENVATIPSDIPLQGVKTVFLSGHTMYNSSSSTAAHAEVYLHIPTRRIRFDVYTTINTATGWIVPLTATIPNDQR